MLIFFISLESPLERNTSGCIVQLPWAGSQPGTPIVWHKTSIYSAIAASPTFLYAAQQGNLDVYHVGQNVVWQTMLSSAVSLVPCCWRWIKTLYCISVVVIMPLVRLERGYRACHQSTRQLQRLLLFLFMFAHFQLFFFEMQKPIIVSSLWRADDTFFISFFGLWSRPYSTFSITLCTSSGMGWLHGLHSL